MDVITHKYQQLIVARLVEAQGVDTRTLNTAPAKAEPPHLVPEGEHGWTPRSWIGSLDLANPVVAALAVAVPAGTSPIDAFRSNGFTQARLERLLDSARLGGLTPIVWDAVQQLRLAATADELQSKFLQDGAGLLSYGNLRAFFGGLEGVIGPPSPKVREAMRAEHVHCGDSSVPFTTGNYGIHTTSTIEWTFVSAPETRSGDEHWPRETKLPGDARPREPRTLSELDRSLLEPNVTLQRLGEPPVSLDEAVAARLYTGPLFVKYNGVLRGIDGSVPFLTQQMVELCCTKAVADSYARGELAFESVRRAHLNTYTTTLHAINSSVVKLGKLSVACKVYRGINGRVLPEQFWTANEFGVRGGVEAAFMSTTTNRDVAMSYSAASGGGAGFVFEMQQGMVDRGADIGFLSQYPHEREILLPPLTGLEVQSARVSGAVMLINVKLSVNLMSLTLEQVIAKMKRSHLQLLELLASPLRSVGAPPRTLLELDGLSRDAVRLDAEWYNDAANYRVATNRALDAQAAAMNAMARGKAWQTAPGAGSGDDSMARRMEECAALCARAGAHESAAGLLLLAADKAANKPSNSPMVVEPEVEAAVKATAGCSGSDENDVRRRLCAALPLIRDGIVQPWPATLASLGGGGGARTQAALAQLVGPLVKQDRFAIGAPVLVCVVDEEDWGAPNWASAQVMRVLADGEGFDVGRAGRRTLTQVPPEHIVAVAEGGAGALLREAAAAGHEALVEGLIALGVSIFEATAEADTALHRAAAAGHVGICRILMSSGANDDVVNAINMSAWNLAGRGRHTAVRRAFNPSPSDKDITELARTGTALLRAASTGDANAVRAALVADCAGGTLNVSADNGVTPLMLASRCGDLECVRVLLEAKADVTAMSGLGCSACMLAAEEGFGEVARALVAAGAAVDEVDGDGWSGLMFACRNGHHMAVSSLLKARAAIDHAADDGRTGLIMAACNGHEHCVNTLIQAGARLDMAEEDGFTALMLAAETGHEAAVRALLRAGSAIEQASSEGYTALMFACYNGHEAIARAIMHQGADVSAARPDGWTALMLACANGHEAAARALLQAGAEVDQLKSSNSSTALMHAAEEGFLSVVRAVLQAGADVNKVRDDGFTPLLLACKGGHEECALALLKEGAHTAVTAVDEDAGGERVSVLSLARSAQLERVVSLLDAQVEGTDSETGSNVANDNE
jgi:ankyrin repeat protein